MIIILFKMQKNPHKLLTNRKLANIIKVDFDNHFHIQKDEVSICGEER